MTETRLEVWKPDAIASVGQTPDTPKTKGGRVLQYSSSSFCFLDKGIVEVAVQENLEGARCNK